MKKFVLNLTLICSFCLLGLTVAQEGPEPSVLQNAFLATLPPGWELSEFTVVAQENYGTSVEPQYKSRFNAQVTLTVDTYVRANGSNVTPTPLFDATEADSSTPEAGRVTLLTPLGTSGEERTFYGIATSLRQLGQWQISFELENNPTAGMGQPRGFFSGRLIIEGSEEAATYLAEQEAAAVAAHEAELTRLAREEQLREQARQTELAEIAHEVAKEEARRQAEREADVAQQAHEAEMQAKMREQQAAAQTAREAELAKVGEALSSDIQNHAAVILPGYWALSDFSISEVARSGSLDAPVFDHSFEATATLGVDTFELVKKDGLITLVKGVEEAGETRTLYGSAHTVFEGGAPQIVVVFESLDGLLVGLPQDQFPGRVIVQGSEAEAAYRAELEDAAQAAHEAELAELARQEELAEKQRAMELAQVAHDKKLLEEQQQLEEARQAQLRAEQAAILQELTEAFAGDDKNRQSTALTATFERGNAQTRARAISFALESGDQQLRARALWQVLSERKTLAGRLYDGEGEDISKERTYAFSFQITEFDANTGNFTGHFQGGVFQNTVLQEEASGSLSENALSIASPSCSLATALTPESLGAMRGTLQCSAFNSGAMSSHGNDTHASFKVLIPVFGVPSSLPAEGAQAE